MWNSLTAATSLEVVFKPWGVIRWPRYSTFFCMKWGFNFNPASSRHYASVPGVLLWSWSRLTHHQYKRTQCGPWDQLALACIRRWKTDGALVSQNGITQNSKRPCRVMNAIFGTESQWSRICQYLDAKSRVVKKWSWSSWSSRSSILGSGYESSLVTEFSSL